MAGWVVDGRICGWMDGWMGGEVDETDGRMGGWKMGECAHDQKVRWSDRRMLSGWGELKTMSQHGTLPFLPPQEAQQPATASRV
jgi:hypothetical protein